MAVDITINETIDLVDITVNPNIIEVNVTRTSGGGGGSQTLEQTLVLGQRTGGKNIIVDDADAVELNNTSLLKKGTYDFGGAGGISRICSVGYEDNWQSGIHHVFDNNGFIRHSTNCFNYIPDITYDSSLRFKVDSLWTLDDGTTYVCTDASSGAAVWEIYNNLSLVDVLKVSNKPNHLPTEIGDYTLVVDDIYRNIFLDGIGNSPQINIGDTSFFKDGDIVDIFTLTNETVLTINSIPNRDLLYFNGGVGAAQIINGSNHIKLTFLKDAGATGEGFFFIDISPMESIVIPVTSVNTLTGDVVLTQDNIGDGATYKQYSQTEKTKLAGIAAGAEVNVNADWNATTGDAQILNKPTIPSLTGVELQANKQNSLTVDGTGVKYPTVDAVNAGIADTNTNAVDRITVKLATAINKGQAVYVSSANGTNIIVSKASNATEATSSKTLGLLETTGATNAIVNVITSGLLGGLDTSTATVGDPVWLGTSGNLIFGLASKPVAPAHLVTIGIVSRVSATVGEIVVRVQNGFELNEIHDVAITSVANEDFLQYESSTSLWKNIQLTATWLKTKIGNATTSVTGLLSSTDWTTFNNKQNNLKTFNRTQGVYYFEEFMGGAGGATGVSYTNVVTAISGVGASCVSSATAPNRTNQQGVVLHTTGTTASGLAGYNYGATTLYIGTGTISIETYITIATLSTSAERFFTQFGYAVPSNWQNTPNAIFFSYDEGGVQFFDGQATPNFKCYTKGTAGTRTFTITTVPVVANQWYKLRIDINAAASSVAFYIDGNLVATHTTNIPAITTPMVLVSQMIKTVGTTARTMYTDYFMYEELFTTTR